MGTGWHAWGCGVAAAAGMLLFLRLVADEIERAERMLGRLDGRERSAQARRLADMPAPDAAEVTEVARVVNPGHTQQAA